jgi:hypothetical protein
MAYRKMFKAVSDRDKKCVAAIHAMEAEPSCLPATIRPRSPGSKAAFGAQR